MRWLTLLLVGACGFPHGRLPGDGGVDDAPDSAIDADIDAPNDPRCFGKTPMVVCLQSLPTIELTLPMRINTGDNGADNCAAVGGTVLPVGSAEACVLSGANVFIDTTARYVLGTRPLIVIATDSMSVSTPNFDITSRTNPTPSDGPNANPTDCMPMAFQNGTSGGNGGAGGGAGGAFGTKGGSGGSGGAGLYAGGTAANPPLAFDKLRGGCRGGSGGDGNAGVAAGGSGGGAIYLIARNELAITGTINASGAGGFGAANRGGGGGGGSGGMIVLHAGSLTIGPAARLIANGGGGGGGAGNGSGGNDGADALTAETAALGGPATSANATSGGNGAFKTTAATSPGGAAHGGGGGGGGAGVIRVLSGQSIPALNTSPAAIN